jgi:hypothetical protein
MLFAGCKENDTPLIFTNKAKADTSYLISPVPATDAHNVLVEEFTGQSCSNCPAAHTVLEGIESGDPAGTVNIIGMYLWNNPQSNPCPGSSLDLRDSTATNIANSSIFGGVSALPGGSVDRVPVSGVIQLSSGAWSGAVTTQLSVADPLNLSVQSTYSATTGLATIIVTVTYTQPVSIAQNISVVVVEDSIIGMQEYPPFTPAYPSDFDTFYVFKNVFRGMVSTPPGGDLINTPSVQKEAGRVYRRTYTYKPKSVAPAIKPQNCRVIAFVNTNNGADYHIVQSAQCPLKP